MTAKQKKNLRKKLYRKRKKLEQSQNNSKLDLSEQSIGNEDGGNDSGKDEEPDLDINIDDVAIGDPAKPKADAKKKAVTGSIERAEPTDVLNGLLAEDNAEDKEKETAASGKPEGESAQDSG